MGTFRVTCPPGCMMPLAPQYTPLGVGSSSAMRRMAWRLGAPVTEPQGNKAERMSLMVAPSRLEAVMVEVICHTVGKACTSNSDGTVTVPVRATRDRSLRSKSTIIKFSARSLALLARCCLACRSASTSKARGAVPFIGRVVRVPWCQSKNSSGEALRTAPAPAAEASSMRA